ncbi:MAG: DUF177 domain-containing protein [Rhizobiales bacterium]|nr:DUF177 domain-containing protein [Hyphomicrobiales bacterium]
MKPPAPEFSRPLEVARVPQGGSYEKLQAVAEECAALAKRIGVETLRAYSGKLHVKPWRGGGLHVTGTMTADLDRVSVVSLQSFAATQDIEIDRYFLPSGAASNEEDDADPIEGGIVDLGEVAAETLALDLDPYPRQPDESFEAPADTSPESSSPFANLSKILVKKS